MSMLGRSISDNSMEEDQLSNTASLKFDQFDVMDNNSDEDEGISRHVRDRRGIHYKEADNGRVVLEVRYLFNNPHHFTQVLRDLVVQEGFQLRRIKNDKDRYTAVCAYEGCSWRIHASLMEDRTTFMIKTLHPRHYCQKVHKNQKAAASWVANRFKVLNKENPYIKVKFLAREKHRIYGLNLPAYTLYRTKNRVLNKTDKENEESCDMLYNYSFMIRERNLGSMAYLQTISSDSSAPARPSMLLTTMSNQSTQPTISMNAGTTYPFIDGEHKKKNVLCASDNGYEVKDGIKFYIVNFETQSCDCCLWELSGILCKHVMAIITAKRMQGQDFMNDYLTKEAYMRIYNNVIHLIPDQAAWPTIKPRKVIPPIHKRMSGCPKKNRKCGPEEGPKQKRNGGVKCRGCGEFGHNMRTCKAKEGGRGK
ncbi:hypothetical protein Dsin_021602 [Dipteronia sinensis]|uniref:SWIM-type domain-containing protein n=1 Tax=Dipteronia sinensis TaxID=43782 RepID=A0AAE0A0Y4_9ROSI|nr:hypothetical protein Dsin_021602 [Dipteronia sinensis]